jgi:hypothetical protein
VSETGDPRIPQRVWRKITVTPAGCWQWDGRLEPTGYARVRVGKRMCLLHRWVYTTLVGPIPDGLECDHLCRNRACGNPSHIEPVTRRENLRRGYNTNAAKTACPQGHPYTPENTMLTRGFRYCKQCNRAGVRAAWRRRKNMTLDQVG